MASAVLPVFLADPQVVQFVQAMLGYLALLVVTHAMGWDAKVLSWSRDPKVRKNAYAMTRDGIKNRAYLCSMVGSTINAFVMVGGAIYLWRHNTNWRQQTPEELVFGEDPATLFLCSSLGGYFASDLLLELRYRISDRAMLVHHIVFLSACVINLYYKVYRFQFIWLAFGEASTPFVNLRWVLHTLGWKDTKLYLWNGVAMTFVFILTRIFLYGLGMLHWMSVMPVVSHMPCHVRIFIPLTGLCGYVLNIIWSAKILKGLYKVVTTSSNNKNNKKKIR
mmetsp:Transcript_15470/g.39413  ORF Transcript_15470/g.39413 Transcript_15470/m.39413 type:complete len:278 (+) Transcript_15470:247-1080(+)